MYFFSVDIRITVYRMEFDETRWSYPWNSVHRTLPGAVPVKGVEKWVFRSSGESKGLGSLGDGGLGVVKV